MHSTNYVIMFILALTSVVAIGLTTLREVTFETAEMNKALFNKREVLKAVADHIGLEPGQKVADLDPSIVLDIFEKDIKQIVVDMDGNEVDQQTVNGIYKGGLAEHIDMSKEKKKDEKDRLLPLYVFTKDGKKKYIVSVIGSGLWDEIWGNIAMEGDLNTVVGASFDHKGETPGLGAEIKDNPVFAAKFKGKKLFRDGAIALNVRKGGARDMVYDVDGISGATVTADGVTEMLQRGIAYYDPYFSKIKTSGK